MTDPVTEVSILLSRLQKQGQSLGTAADLIKVQAAHHARQAAELGNLGQRLRKLEALIAAKP